MIRRVWEWLGSDRAADVLQDIADAVSIGLAAVVIVGLTWGILAVVFAM